MSSARRRTTSSSDRTHRHHFNQGSKVKPQITLQRRIQGNLDALQLPTSISSTLPIASRTRRKMIYVVIATGLLTIMYLLFRVTERLTITPNRRLEDLTSSSRQLGFPSIATLTPQGRVVLEELSLKSTQSLPSQLTFVFAVLKQTARGTLPLISRLQLLDTQVHILVPENQAADLDYLLETLLPSRDGISVYPSNFDSTGTALVVLHHAKRVETPWVWIMSDNLGSDLQALETWIDKMALKTPRIQVPTGLYGARLTEFGASCISPTNRAEPAAFLVPPFLAQTNLLVESESGIIPDTQTNVWASLGERIAHITKLGMGGVVVSTAYSYLGQCEMSHMVGSQGSPKVSKGMVTTLLDRFRSPIIEKLHFAVFLPNLTSLERIAPTVCRILQNGHELTITVQRLGDTRGLGSNKEQYLNHGCHFHYIVSSDAGDGYERDILALASSWCGPVPLRDKILVFGGGSNGSWYNSVLKTRVCATTVIYLQDKDLGSSEWLSMLTAEEWRAWDKPTIELAVITHDRPWSLQRLLDSVKRAHYFGDTVNMVINLEQTADQETRRIAEGFTMGSIESRISVRHRIVYAGLMTAVVESWYPHGNHSYGVILEDDVELSPLFYAWIKFCVLRYRYGTPPKDASPLYGISLYQPKVTELHMEGRRPFNARDLFAKANIEHPHTPYLSQVPCSWGAVYFPEHWREFQQYLSLRLSEHVMPATDIVVPNLRSNKWSRSWKKFFNEMVYLQGYVSLYPNYEYFVSLSTNHLEVGEHVPANINQEKQNQYFLPLMQEPEIAKRHPGTKLGVELLDLPLSDLPKWADLPALDLWGGISTLERLRDVGLERRVNMSVCQFDETQPSALEYLCPPKEVLRPGVSHKIVYDSSTEDDDPDLMQG